jgi:hypothetical protein
MSFGKAAVCIDLCIDGIECGERIPRNLYARSFIDDRVAFFMGTLPMIFVS